MENCNQTVFDSDTYGGGVEMAGGAKGDTKFVPILHKMFESITKYHKEPSPKMCKIYIIDIENFAHGLP
jgi:hypothetical protein